jgi:hypothetical protein
VSNRGVAILGLTMLAMTGAATASTWGQQTTITGYYTWDSGGAYINTANNQNPDGCTSSTYLYINDTTINFKTIWASVIAAQTTGSTVTLHYDGCVGPYPRITAVAVPRIWP